MSATVEQVATTLNVDEERAREILRVGRHQRRGSTVPRLLYEGKSLDEISEEVAQRLDLVGQDGGDFAATELERIFDEVRGLPWTGCMFLIPTGATGYDWMDRRQRLVGIKPDPRLASLGG